VSADALRAALQCGRPGCTCHRPRGNVHCPAHDDAHPSLSVDEAEGGRVLVHCFASCSQEEVIGALHARGLWDGKPPAPVLSRLRRGRLEGPLNDAARFIERYIRMPSDHATNAAALWVAHCYVLDAFDVTPYLLVKSPVKRCAKSRLLSVLALLLPKPWMVLSPSEAVLFRKITRDCPQVLIDESDPLFKGRIEQHEPLRALLNAGFERGAVVPRCVGEGSKKQLVDFEVFCPKAIAAIGDLPDTIEDRSIVIAMKRATPEEKKKLARFRRREAREEAVPIREAMGRWAAANLSTLRDARPELPDALDDRAQDLWEPLLAVADLAGAGWAVAAWAAALALSTGAAREDESTRIRLLADCQRAFEERKSDRLVTADLIEALAEDEAAPWGDWHGRRITPQGLARLLRPFGVQPVVIRVGTTTLRGYRREDFEDAWSRYLPAPSPDGASDPKHPKQSSQGAGSSHLFDPQQTPLVTGSENGANPVRARVVTGVTDKTPSGGEGAVEEDHEGAPLTPPDGHCHACGQGRFWRSVYGSLVCVTCHPPAVPALVARWWVRRPSGRWLPVRTAHQTRVWRCTSPPEAIRAAVRRYQETQAGA